MFAAANQTHFSLAIDGLALDLQVLSFSGREAISGEPAEFGKNRTLRFSGQP
ncbi:hypothetical protein H2N76_34485 [Pseudomonas aeruginosa]|nr:hypothetical protein [Pseudomonas aeruginosa]